MLGLTSGYLRTVLPVKYPQGQLRIQLSRSCQNPYSLCLAGSSSTRVAEVREVTGGANKLLNLPTAGKPACTLAINGASELLVVADADLAFRASFNYTVVTKPQTG